MRIRKLYQMKETAHKRIPAAIISYLRMRYAYDNEVQFYHRLAHLGQKRITAIAVEIKLTQNEKNPLTDNMQRGKY